MIIIWGSYFCGKCDEVPRLCHVETHFGHLYYIPLLPIGSYAVFGPLPNQKLPVGFALKSVLVGWLRAACVLGAILGGGVLFLNVFNPRHLPLAILGALFAACCVGTFVVTKKLRLFTQASYTRALEIARLTGVTPEGLLMIEVAYGRLTAEQADNELQKIEAQQAEQARLEEERMAKQGASPYNFGQQGPVQAEIVPGSFSFK